MNIGAREWVCQKKSRKLCAGACPLVLRLCGPRLGREQGLIELRNSLHFRGPVNGGEFTGKPVKRELEEIALTKAAAGTVCGRLQVPYHLGHRRKFAGIDLRQILLARASPT